MTKSKGVRRRPAWVNKIPAVEGFYWMRVKGRHPEVVEVVIQRHQSSILRAERVVTYIGRIAKQGVTPSNDPELIEAEFNPNIIPVPKHP